MTLENQLNSLDLPGAPEDNRIVVAMSGGVDSSVVAAKLKREGYDVVGITLQLYDHGEAIMRKGACCAGRDIHDARRVAELLDIPHYVLDYEDRFRDSVMEDFADSYLAGETPIPCIQCNQKVKFKDLFDMAKDLGAAAMATGHYITSKRLPGGDGRRALHRAVDENRDQSYFLFTTTDEQLEFLRFPLGELHKSEVRELAVDLGLSVADKPDSQDICFVPSGNYASVIERLRPHAANPGDIVNIQGEVLGHHKGIINYTIGQRRGLGIAARDPLYVVGLNVDKSEVIVGPREVLLTRRIVLRDINWLGDISLGDQLKPGEFDFFVKVRSTHRPLAGSLTREGAEIVVYLAEGEYGVSAGQACVFYDGSESGARVLGGGWIKAAENCLEESPEQTEQA
jgi:tRNA-uridine 2-sulfurtransferase